MSKCSTNIGMFFILYLFMLLIWQAEPPGFLNNGRMTVKVQFVDFCA